MSQLSPQLIPLADCEEFMVRDNYPGYPNTIVARVRLSGKLNRAILAESFKRTFARHPLAQSPLVRRRGRFFWKLNQPCYRLHEIVSRSSVDDYPDMPAYDMYDDPGMHMYFVEDEKSSDVVFQIQHGCCDGLGGMQIITDWLLIYAQLCESPNREPKLRRLAHEALETRNNFGFSTWNYWKAIHKQAIGLAGVFEFQLRRPVEVVPNSVRDVNTPPEGPYPRAVTHEFTPEQQAALQQVATDCGATTNELLIRDLLTGINQWRTKYGYRRDGDRLRIMVPINMREFAHRRMSAANRVSFVAIDRSPEDCRHPKRLLNHIHGQMEVIHRLKLDLVFPAMLAVFCRIPGALRRMTNPERCASTALLTNLGDPFARVKLPRTSDGRLIAGDLVMDGLDLLAPLRPKTNISISAFRYAGKMCLTMNYDPRTFTTAEAKDLLASYVRRILRTIEPDDEGKNV